MDAERRNKSPLKVVLAALGGLLVLGAATMIFQAVLNVDGPRPGDPDDPAQVAKGERLYLLHCAECHGKNLEGQPDWRGRKADGTLPAPPHDETGHTWHHSDALLFDYTKKGGQPLAPEGFTSAMPGFEDKMTDAGIWATLAYIKSTWPAAVRARQERMNR